MAWEKFESAKCDVTLPALILIIDEYAQFVDDLPRDKQRIGDEVQQNVQKITRLGRSAHIHLIIATQSASSNLFPQTLRNNIGFRNICGRVDANISRMAIDSEEGESIPLVSGSYLMSVKGDTQQYRGWYTPLSKVLELGTIKEGFNPKTGLQEGGADSYDPSAPIEDDIDICYEESNEEIEETEKEESDDFFDVGNEDVFEVSSTDDIDLEGNNGTEEEKPAEKHNNIKLNIKVKPKEKEESKQSLDLII